jgi:putative DNA-binding protein
MSLLALQSAFRAWLPSRENSSPSLFGDSCAPGLRVYRNNYRSQLINCLEHSFPRVREWLGPEAFLSVCTGHVDSVAPGSWTIDAYALGLLPTLAKHYPSDPDVTELAWLEWALGEAFISRDEAAVSAEDLDSVDWDNAVLHFVNSATVRPAQTNAGQIWAALADRQLPPAAERLAPGCGYLVWRQGFEAHFRTLDSLEHTALLSVSERATFAEVCETLVEGHGEEEAIALAGQWLGRWIGDGLIARVTTRDR